MSDVTEADREKAQRILDTAPLLDMGGAIARALAEERAKARAPFLALAEELESVPRGEIMPVSGAARLLRDALASTDSHPTVAGRHEANGGDSDGV